MIRSEHKPLLKRDIYELRFNNHEKQLSTYSSFHKKFSKKNSTKNLKPNNKNEKDNENDKNIHLISLLSNKIISKGDKKLFDMQTNYNSYSPYVNKMMVNAAKLIKYNPTRYMPKEILSSKSSEESLNNSNIKTDLKIKKNFFGLNLKIPDEIDSNNKILSKSPSTILKNIKDEEIKINNELFTIEDDIFANKIFNKTHMSRNSRNDNIIKKNNQNQINTFFEKYSIEKDLTNEEKKAIKKEINNTLSINKKNYLISPLEINEFPKNEIFTKTYTAIKDYENPYHSLKNIKINSQLKETVGKIRNNLQFKKYQEQFNSICDFKISKSRMPNIKALNKPNLIKKKDLLKNKNVINYFKQHKNNLINKRKIKDLNIIKNYDDNNKNNEQEENDNLTYEERIKRMQIEIWHLECGYHPESRLMSTICFDFDDKKLYNYGGLGGIIYGDLWACKFNENKVEWEKIYAYNYDKIKELNIPNYNAPSPRFGHTCHFYKKKIFIIGGEYKDWKKDLPYEDLLWIYDIEKMEWISLHKYELKNKLTFDKRSSISSHLFKLRKNFSDMLLKIPLLIPQNLESSKNDNYKKINKTIFTKSIKKEKKIFKKLRPNLRRNHISLLIGSHIFIYGGVSQSKEILNDCWIYDLKLCQWAMIESIGRHPLALAHHSACLAIEKDQLINDTFNVYHKPKNIRGTVDLLKLDGVFFFGGINNNKIPSNSLFHMTIGIKPVIFDIPNIVGRPPKPRIDASMDFAQNINMIIIYGGKNEMDFPCYYADMSLLDLRIMNWIQPTFMKEKPNKRAQHMSIVIGDELIIFGGTNGIELLNYDFTVVDLNLFNK